MTFLHKLAQRLARMKAPAMATLVAVAACELPTRAAEPSAPVTTLILSPKTSTLLTNEVTDFVAVGLTADGDTGSVALNWSVTGGNILEVSLIGGRHVGRYTSPLQTGRYTVTVRTSAGTPADSAVIDVTAAPVATVAVTPASADVPVGGTVQLSAALYDQNGGLLAGRVVTWTTGNAAVATVTASGVVAGVAAGSATITATSEGQSGTSAITVTTSATKPGTVTDLVVQSVTANGVTLGFTEVGDGAGQPATYDVRWAPAPIVWGSAPHVTLGTCATPLAGTAIGAGRTCTVLGLAAATAYEFQLVAYRGTLDVNAVYGALSNIAGATTAASTEPVASVTVTPASAGIGVGQTVQLTATLRDANGNLLGGRAVTWSSGAPAVASVDGSGLVTGIAAGLVTITATSEGQSGSSSVTVSELVSGYPNQPGGLVPFAEHHFSCLPATGSVCAPLGTWTNEPGGLGNFSIQLASNAPQTPDSVGQTRFPNGHPSGSAPVWFDGWGIGGYASVFYRKLYLSMWVRIVGTNYENQAVGTKMGFVGYGEDPSGAANQGFFMLIGNGSQSIGSAFNLGFWQQNHVSRDMNQNVDGSKVMTVGPWHRWEMVLELNTLGSANGVFKWWVDGNLIMSYSNVVYITSGNTNGFYNYRWNPTWGGQGGTKTRDDFMQMDHIYLSGAP